MNIGNIRERLKNRFVQASAPCRIDFGGTLDIGIFHYPLKHLKPSTVNIALDLRTTVTLKPNPGDQIRIRATGFQDARFDSHAAPYDHPLGLMFAVADYFNASGVHIDVDSASPPKSGLGGSSVAAVALIAAFSQLLERLGKEGCSKGRMALLAHAIEQNVAGVLCGKQDQLAAAFGGVNQWAWPALPGSRSFVRTVLSTPEAHAHLDNCLLVAYLGVTHVSKDVNSTWVHQFIEGKTRDRWREIIELTDGFAKAIRNRDLGSAVDAMNRETAIRKTMTPHVLDEMGDRLAAAAVETSCGVRFTGAGGGGCLWALGEAGNIATLKSKWAEHLAARPSAGLLDCRVDNQGVIAG